MSCWIQNIQDLSNDVLGEIQEQVKLNRQRQYWKNAMDETIKDIKNDGPHLVVYRYPDGCVPPNFCPYYLCEFMCCEEDDDNYPKIYR